MTTYHLKFWNKSCGSTDIERIYVNGEDRSTLGYFEMRTLTEERGVDTYYDRHRIAKGDTVAEVERTYTTTVPADIAAAIYAAPSIAAALEAQKMDDGFARFYALKQHARGVQWMAWTAAQKKELRERSQFTIDLPQ